MAIYLIILFYLLLNVIFEMAHIQVKPKIIAYLLIVVILIMVAGLRYGLETDYWHYYDIFHGIVQPPTLEIGFSSLIFITKIFTNSYVIFCLILALIGLGIVSGVIYQFKYPFIMLLCYYARFYVLFNLNAVRQGIAVAFIFLGIYYLTNKDDKKIYIFLVLLATLFHASSILVLPCVLLKNRDIKPRVMIILYSLALFFRFYLFNGVISSFSPFINLVVDSDNSLIHGAQYIINSGDKMQGMNYFSFIQIIVTSIALYFLQRNTKDHRLFKMYFIGSLINIIFWGLNTISFRVPADFYLTECFILNAVFERQKFISKNTNIMSIIWLIIVLAFNISSLITLFNTSATLVPYRSVFSPGINILGL